MLKRLIYLFPVLAICQSKAMAQGVYNNGARIVFTGGAQMYIDGATGNYLNVSNGFITPSASSSITLLGNWTNNGGNNGFTADGGGVVLAGAAQNIGGSSATAFNNLSLTGTNTKQLTVNSTTVGGQAVFNGVLSLGTRPLNLNGNLLAVTNPATGAITQSGGYIISETNAAVNPSIVRWYMRTTGGAHVFPFGVVAGTQIPFTFNATTPMTNATGFIDVSTRATAASDNQPWAGASNVGAVSFMYCPNNTTSGNTCAAGSVIDRWWDVTNSHPVTADLTFTYRGVENTLLPAFQTGLIGAQFWNGSLWVLNNATFGGTAGVTTGTSAVIATGQSTFCPWVLSTQLAPLPIELINFSVLCESQNVVNVIWNITGDTQGSYYEIENSNDGHYFTKIASVNANGTGNYKYTIDNPSALGNYYRLKIVDNNLNARLSKIESTNEDCHHLKEESNVFYHPNTGLVVNISSNRDNRYQLTIYDAAGRIIKVNTLPVVKGPNTFRIDPALANGIYIVSLSDGSDAIKQSKKIPVINQN